MNTANEHEKVDIVNALRHDIEQSGLSIKEVATRANLNSRHLEQALTGTGGAKLGLLEAAAVCKIIDAKTFFAALTPEGMELVKLPKPDADSTDPVDHINASLRRLGTSLVLCAPSDAGNTSRTEQLARLVAAAGAFITLAANLAQKTSVSPNELKELSRVQMAFIMAISELQVPVALRTPLLHVAANVNAASRLLEDFLPVASQ